VLPMSQTKVGDKGRRWWGKGSAGLRVPEHKASASASMFCLAWCQPPSLPLRGTLGTHRSVCVQLPVRDLGCLDGRWGEHAYARHAYTGTRVARQAALQEKLYPSVRSLDLRP